MAHLLERCSLLVFLFLRFFFKMWNHFKVFIEFVAIPLLCYVLVFWPKAWEFLVS